MGAGVGTIVDHEVRDGEPPALRRLELGPEAGRLVAIEVRRSWPGGGPRCLRPAAGVRESVGVILVEQAPHHAPQTQKTARAIPAAQKTAERMSQATMSRLHLVASPSAMMA